MIGPSFSRAQKLLTNQDKLLKLTLHALVQDETLIKKPNVTLLSNLKPTFQFQSKMKSKNKTTKESKKFATACHNFNFLMTAPFLFQFWIFFSRILCLDADFSSYSTTLKVFCSTCMPLARAGWVQSTTIKLSLSTV